VFVGKSLILALVFISISKVIDTITITHLIKAPVSNIFIAIWKSHFSFARSFAVEKLAFVDFAGAIFKYPNRAYHRLKAFISSGLLWQIIFGFLALNIRLFAACWTHINEIIDHMIHFLFNSTS